ncbi:crossover junction endodeoxyribonuclease RuvC, partial [Patescibacteria group bacterium]|nr:crossover junction endodeoxyribonuclease RuvC [Patescibacteria group bacterium]
MIIAGVDPGLATTGFAFINKTKEGIKVIDYGCIYTTPDLCQGDRLKKINTELAKLIKLHKPNVMAVERLFYFKNLKTVMPVSEAKGVILLTAAKNKLPVFEYTPLQMKMAIAGYGRAEKKQVQKMIQVQLNLEEKPDNKDKRKDDATDALGIAMCYA